MGGDVVQVGYQSHATGVVLETLVVQSFHFSFRLENINRVGVRVLAEERHVVDLFDDGAFQERIQESFHADAAAEGRGEEGSAVGSFHAGHRQEGSVPAQFLDVGYFAVAVKQRRFGDDLVVDEPCDDGLIEPFPDGAGKHFQGAAHSALQKGALGAEVVVVDVLRGNVVLVSLAAVGFKVGVDQVVVLAQDALDPEELAAASFAQNFFHGAARGFLLRVVEEKRGERLSRDFKLDAQGGKIRFVLFLQGFHRVDDEALEETQGFIKIFFEDLFDFLDFIEIFLQGNELVSSDFDVHLREVDEVAAPLLANGAFQFQPDVGGVYVNALQVRVGAGQELGVDHGVGGLVRLAFVAYGGGVFYVVGQRVGDRGKRDSFQIQYAVIHQIFLHRVDRGGADLQNVKDGFALPLFHVLAFGEGGQSASGLLEGGVKSG